MWRRAHQRYSVAWEGHLCESSKYASMHVASTELTGKSCVLFTVIAFYSRIVMFQELTCSDFLQKILIFSEVLAVFQSSLRKTLEPPARRIITSIAVGYPFSVAAQMKSCAPFISFAINPAIKYCMSFWPPSRNPLSYHPFGFPLMRE